MGRDVEPELHDSRVSAPAGRAGDRLHRGILQRFPERKSAAEIMQRLDGREFQILMAEAPLPDDPSTVVPVSYKVSHELRAEETDPKLADLVARLTTRSSSSEQKILYNWLGATRLDWRGQGHFRALTEEQEVWAVAPGTTKSRQDQEPLLRHARHARQPAVQRHQARDRQKSPLESKVYLSKRLGPYVLDAHRSRRQVTRV